MDLGFSAAFFRFLVNSFQVTASQLDFFFVQSTDREMVRLSTFGRIWGGELVSCVRVFFLTKLGSFSALPFWDFL